MSQDLKQQRDSTLFSSQQLQQRHGSLRPFSYFSSLLRKFKGRLSTVHGFRASLDSSSFNSSTTTSTYATLPRTATDSVVTKSSNKQQVVIDPPPPPQSTQLGSSNQSCDNCYNLEESLVSTIQSAQIFGTLPRDGSKRQNGNKRNRQETIIDKSTLPPSSNSHFSGYLTSRRGSDPSSLKPVICYPMPIETSGSVHSLATLPRQKPNATYFWEETGVAKQCQSLFKDCRSALDGVAFAVDKYFGAEGEAELELPGVRKHRNCDSIRQARLVETVRSTTSQLLLLLVELRNVLTQPAKNSLFNSQHAQTRQDFVTTALLIPVGALLSHLARLCDLFALSDTPAVLLSPSDSGISMKSTPVTVRHYASSPENSACSVGYSSTKRSHPLKNQTVHVVNSLRDTLNRIDEGLPAMSGVVRKSTSANDDLPANARPAKPLYKTTVTMNTSDNDIDNNRSTLQMTLTGQSVPDRRGHGKLSALERNLKTVSFETATPTSSKRPMSSPRSSNLDSSPCRIPDVTPERPRTGRSGRSTGLYDNVECYSPGPDYAPIPVRYRAPKQPQWSNSAELFIDNSTSNAVPREIPVLCSGTPSKPPLSPPNGTVKNQHQVPVWVCRQPEAPLTPPITTDANQAHHPSKRSCSQPPPNVQITVPHTMVQAGAGPGRLPQPMGQGSFQDILLMDQVDSLLELSEKPGEKGLVRSGPTDALIVYASLPSQTEAHRTFVDAFLSTYCTFLTPEQLVDKLIYRFEKLSTESARLNGTTPQVQSFDLDDPKQKLACSTLCLLVHVVSSLSTSDALLRWPALRSRLAEFVYTLLRRPGLWHLAVALRRELLRAESNLQILSTSAHQNLNGDVLLLSPVSHSQSESHFSAKRPANLLDFRSRRLAEQMTLLDWRLFEVLDLSELLVYATNCSSGNNEHTLKADVSLQTPRLTNFTRHFNDVSLWARTVILKQDNEKMRERYMLKLAKVVQHLRQLQNFNSSLALLSALDSAAVLRLASSSRVLKRIKSVVNSLRDLTDSSGSFKAYRNILENCHPPAIPYLGLTLSDLTFLHLGCPDVLREDSTGGGAINFEKRLRQHRILESVRRFKASHAVYNFAPDSDCLVFFDNFANHWDEEMCWTQSERIKPRTPMGSSNQVTHGEGRQVSNHLSHRSCVSSATK